MWRGSEIWLLPYLRHPKRAQFEKPTDVIIAVCDHFEPFHHTDKQGALDRLKDWQTRFLRLTESFRDSDGHPPKQTFFYPIEQYDADLIEPLAELCKLTGSEVEIHLHHDDDSEAQLREALEQGKTDLAKHQLLSTNSEQQIEYGFIHGNWALDNSDPRGRHCGVQRELQVLKETGCYADFTMPSAPTRPRRKPSIKSTTPLKPKAPSHATTAPQSPLPPSRMLPPTHRIVRLPN